MVSLAGDLGIVAVAFIWGTANVVIRYALAGISPFWFSALRFLVACVTIWLIFGRRAIALPKRMRLAATGTGMILSAGYLLATWALIYTTAGNESFILSMPVVFVPIGAWILGRGFPGPKVVLAAGLCVAGMLGLMQGGNFSLASGSLNRGDIMCFIALLCLTSFILLVGNFVESTDPLGLVPWQALGVFSGSIIVALLFEPLPRAIPASSWAAVLYTGTVGFALTLLLQNVSQRYTSPTRTSILLSTQGVFGSVTGVLFLNEPMTASIFVSSALILVGVLVASVPGPIAKSQSGSEW